MNETSPSEEKVDLEKAKEEFQTQMAAFEKMTTLGLLAMGVAHEINNSINFVFNGVVPLRNDISAIVELLNKYHEITLDCDLKQKLQEIQNLRDEIDIDFTIKEVTSLIGGVQEGARRTVELIKDLQGYSRMESKELESVNINACIDSALNLLLNRYKNRVEIVKKYGTIPDVKCYEGKINQVFVNIIINAVQAIQEKGSLYITTDADGDHVRISFKDTGIGMDESVKAKIFDLFFTTKSKNEGTGLGLAITSKIIGDHGGTIDVKSTVGEGTEFIITLPRNPK